MGVEACKTFATQSFGAERLGTPRGFARALTPNGDPSVALNAVALKRSLRMTFRPDCCFFP